ncbi:MAG: NADH-quinone oxidoreductase subunit G [Pseudomonadota bacterium]|nr:NADH-quinone oxidoreductase subunit G [Pseudomonadota bacterium]MDE3038360.1 NADH-quinone oxidoreductase subunit G [Pseudomonadota bacterium]
MPKLTIDGIEIEVEPGTVIIQAAERLGIEIPRFCYHERLAIAGNCRMCLVEVSPGPPKPQASCALPCADGMAVKTNSPMVKKAREGVMEFLLINHPLDCPICDQGGECDLQDQALLYGQGKSRYKEAKRAVEDKYMGPIVKTQMTRCIHCTRCIRFAADIAGVPELGAFGRGEQMEVGTYIEKSLTSELSGNLVDICPVGALTSRPYAFVARPWDLKKTESIDVLDAVGSNIRIDARGEAVLRVLPRVHEDINEEWISDKTRHACDGLKLQRLDRPYVRNAEGKLVEATWQEAFAVIAEVFHSLQPEQIAAIAGDLACAESVMALRDLWDSFGVASRDCRQDGAAIDATSRAHFLFNSTIAGIEQADVCAIIGANPRREAALVNARIRKAWRGGKLSIYQLGAEADLNYPYGHLGNDPRILADIAAGRHPLADALKAAKHPLLILGSGALARPDGAEIFAAARAIADSCNLVKDGWNGFNVLHYAAGRAGALELGFVPSEGGRDMHKIMDGCRQDDIKLVYLLGADEFDMALLSDAFVVYQGHHGDAGAHRADIVLPGAAYTEKDATYVNLEGRVQRAQRAVFPPGQAKEDWTILRALSEVLGKKLPYDNLAQLRARMEKIAPHFAQVGEITPAAWPKAPERKGHFRIDAAPFGEFIPNFYMTDPISRASKTMAECTRASASPYLEEVA